MRRFLIVSALLAAASRPVATENGAAVLRPPLRVDPDDRDIPQPGERLVSEIYAITYNSWLRHLDLAYKADKWRRTPALNVNAWDEIPDSSWFTNRIGVRPLQFDDIAASLPGLPPAPGAWRIVRVNDEGYTPKFDVQDPAGRTYVLKLDPPEALERNSAAERICTLIAHAAGYHVPHNSIVRFHADDLRVDEKSYYRDAMGHRRPLTPADVGDALKRITLLPDGRYRALASQFLPTPVGRFVYTGLRTDDPNDIIPHEMRRELRGLRVIASWINHVDVGDKNALDAYVEENARRFIRHYLLDFGSAMGSGDFVNGPYRVGHEYIVDGRATAMSLITLGAWHRPWERHGRIQHDEVGYYASELFEPARWKPNYPNLAFERMDDGDAYWGAKIVTAFGDDTIDRLAEAGEYTRAEVTKYVAEVLRARRNAIGRYWFDRVTPLEEMRLERTSSGLSLHFRDLALERGTLEPPSRTYRFWAEDLNGRRIIRETIASSAEIDLHGLESIASQGSKRTPDRYGRIPVARIHIQSNRRQGEWAAPIEVVVGHSAGSPSLEVLGWTHAPR